VGDAMRRLWQDRFGITAEVRLLEVDTEGLRAA